MLIQSGVRNIPSQITGVMYTRKAVDNIDFSEKDIPYSLVHWSHLSRCDFNKTNLKKSSLIQSIFLDCYFSRCGLIEANLSGSIFRYCDFTDADMSFCDFTDSTFIDCKFNGCIMIRATGIEGREIELEQLGAIVGDPNAKG